MLLLQNKHRAVLIDLGWFPEHQASGRFRLTAMRLTEDGESGEWDRPLRRIRTRSKKKVVQTLEDWLEWYSNHLLPPRRKGRA
jgi:hypothetical protein